MSETINVRIVFYTRARYGLNKDKLTAYAIQSLSDGLFLDQDGLSFIHSDIQDESVISFHCINYASNLIQVRGWRLIENETLKGL